MDGAEVDGSLKAVGGTHGVSPYRSMGSIVRAFLSLGQGEPLPRSGIAREINLLSCASCLSFLRMTTRDVRKKLVLFPRISLDVFGIIGENVGMETPILPSERPGRIGRSPHEEEAAVMRIPRC